MPRACRSYLFVPGDRPDRFEKALATGADGVIIDLEDAVAPAAKDRARATVSQWLRSAPAKVTLRINAVGTEWFRQDLALCQMPNVAAVLLAKTEQPEEVAAVSAAGSVPVLALIETAVGFCNLRALAAAPRIERLVFGSIDLEADLGMNAPTEEELLYFRSQIVLFSRLAGIAPPVDGVTAAIDDTDRLREDVLRARRLGFGGKLCIHPRQIVTVNAHFAPSDEEHRWAQRVLEAAARSSGAAVQLDGKMIDMPVILRAEAIVREVADRSAHHSSNRESP